MPSPGAAIPGSALNGKRTGSGEHDRYPTFPPECSLPAGENHYLWAGEDTTEEEIIGVLREATAGDTRSMVLPDE